LRELLKAIQRTLSPEARGIYRLEAAGNARARKERHPRRTPLMPYGHHRGAPVASQQSRILRGGGASLPHQHAGGHDAV